MGCGWDLGGVQVRSGWDAVRFWVRCMLGAGGVQLGCRCGAVGIQVWCSWDAGGVQVGSDRGLPRVSPHHLISDLQMEKRLEVVLSDDAVNALHGASFRISEAFTAPLDVLVAARSRPPYAISNETGASAGIEPAANAAGASAGIEPKVSEAGASAGVEPKVSESSAPKATQRGHHSPTQSDRRH